MMIVPEIRLWGENEWSMNAILGCLHLSRAAFVSVGLIKVKKHRESLVSVGSDQWN